MTASTGVVAETVAGTPQGGVISPLLANVYLHAFDRAWAERGTGEVVRYVAAPTLTIDPVCRSSADIPIEHRHSEEVAVMAGHVIAPWALRSRTVPSTSRQQRLSHDHHRGRRLAPAVLK